MDEKKYQDQDKWGTAEKLALAFESIPKSKSEFVSVYIKGILTGVEFAERLPPDGLNRAVG